MHSYSDAALARDLCDKEPNAISYFLELYSDELYFIASKFNNRGNSEDAWEYRTKKGYSIRVSDEVSDTFLWLKDQATNKSCSYKGLNGAQFSTYIKSVLNSSYTFKDWLKWKTGVTGFIPKCIKGLSDIHCEVYTFLRQGKNEVFICKELNIDKISFYELYNDIEESLISSNQIDLLRKPNILSMHNENSNEEGIPHLQYEDSSEINPSDKPDIERIKNVINQMLENLRIEERRLLIFYWYEKYDNNKIMESLSLIPRLKSLENLGISKESDVYRAVDKVLRKANGYLVNHEVELYKEWQLDVNKVKNLLKTYFQFIY